MKFTFEPGDGSFTIMIKPGEKIPEHGPETTIIHETKNKYKFTTKEHKKNDT